MKNKIKTIDIFTESRLEDMDICIICGKPHIARTDKRGHPFIRCHFCGLFAFLNTPMAEVGYKVLARIVKKNIKQHEKMIEAGYRNFMDDQPLITK